MHIGTKIGDLTMTNTLAPTNAAMATLAQSADHAAAGYVFADFRSRKAANTLRAHDADLASFAEFLGFQRVTVDAAALATDPAAWSGVSWGVVDAFVKWLLQRGYAVGSVNRKLSTVKCYARLASKAGVIDAGALRLVETVSGYSRGEGMELDKRRPVTRTGAKKTAHTPITRRDAALLKAGRLVDSPQGIRDDLMMALLLDHGMRVSEVAGLLRENVNLADGTFTFWSIKVKKWLTHAMTTDSRTAFLEYIGGGHAPASGPILRPSRQGGELVDGAMSVRAINKRVGALGREIGLDTLSPHDCRHYYATTAARNGTDAMALRDAGGWSSLAMPGRYVERAKIANRGVNLG